MLEARSVCRICSGACGVIVTIDDVGRAINGRGDRKPSHPRLRVQQRARHPRPDQPCRPAAAASCSAQLGDCFAYACAGHAGMPLLYKGDDFPKTDIETA